MLYLIQWPELKINVIHPSHLPPHTIHEKACVAHLCYCIADLNGLSFIQYDLTCLSVRRDASVRLDYIGSVLGTSFISYNLSFSRPYLSLHSLLGRKK
jgi:hypothetical protein